jgi:hypothetical protein
MVIMNVLEVRTLENMGASVFVGGLRDLQLSPAINRVSASEPRRPQAQAPSVSQYPGMIAFTRIFLIASSSASTFVMAFTAGPDEV